MTRERQPGRKNRMANSSEFAREMIKAAKKMGWEVTRTSNDHLKVTKEGMPPIFASLTPSSGSNQQLKATVARMKRAEKAADAKATAD